MTSPPDRSRPRLPASSSGPKRGARPRRRGWRLAGLSAFLIVILTGCDVPTFGYPDGITNQTPRLLRLWQGSVIAALSVGVFVWGLIFWAVFAYYKRSDKMPRQVRYNLPVEILYTAVPFVIIAGLFFYTARDEIKVNELPPNPEVRVGVVAFRWNWQFRYLDQDMQPTGIQVTGRPGDPAVLVLPEGRSIRFLLTSPDVIHSFWVPEFLFKRDVIPGHPNEFALTITKTGTFIGRCAEFCGTNHDQMDFYVKVVPGGEFDTYLANLRAGPAATAGASLTNQTPG